MIEKGFKLWLGAPTGVPDVLKISRYDTAWKFVFTVFNGADVYEVPNTAAAVLVGRKPDGTIFTYDCTVESGNVCVVSGDQLSTAEGEIVCELRISIGGTLVGTCNFKILVETAPYSGFLLSENDYSGLDQLVNQALEAASNAGDAASAVAEIRASVSNPFVIVHTVAEMTDHEKAYVYVGVETGYEFGSWYYWDGTAWVYGGIATDTTLENSGIAADSKTVGDRINTIYDEFVKTNENLKASKMDAFQILTQLTPSETKTNYIWNGKTNALVSWNDYTAYKYSVSPGDVITAVGCQTTTWNLLYCIYDANNVKIDSGAGKVPYSSGTKSYTFVVPDDAAYMWINTVTATQDDGAFATVFDANPESASKRQIAVTVSSIGATFETNGFKFVIQRCGANDLVNLYQGYYNGTQLFSTNTDWIGPYKFYRVSGASGDFPQDTTTGGNHTATDGTTTVTTAQHISFSVVGDGQVLTTGKHYVRSASIQWVNQVMAGNTVKLDGTGEYCLEEHCRIEVMLDGELKVHHWFKPFYDCKLKWYSGLQFAGKAFAPYTYIPQYSTAYLDTSEINAASVPELEVDRYYAIGSTVSLEMYLDRKYGLGTHNSLGHVTGNASKSYLTIQNSLDDPYDILANNIYSWRGSYRFFKSF